MSTCEVQKMNPISQESPTYVKYIVPLYQFIYQPTECQLDSQDGAGIRRVVGANALPQLSSSGWLPLPPSPWQGLPGHGNLLKRASGVPAVTPRAENERRLGVPVSARPPLMKMSGRGREGPSRVPVSPQPGDQMR